MNKALCIFLFVSSLVFGQKTPQTLVIGNATNICFADSTLKISDTLPSNLDSFSVIFMFSNATSQLKETDIESIETFLTKGGGVYTGSDNWPLQAEANQITNQFYQKESFGLYDATLAQTNTDGNLRLKDLDSVPAGRTTSAFPLDYRLTVEAWVDDQPLILSGKYGKGRIVIDTGYSRFYCDQRDKNTDALFERIQQFLKKEDDE